MPIYNYKCFSCNATFAEWQVQSKGKIVIDQIWPMHRGGSKLEDETTGISNYTHNEPGVMVLFHAETQTCES